MASISVPFALHVYYKWPATPMLPVPEGGDEHYMDRNYVVPWCRTSPYFAGVVLGYILHKTKNKKIKIPRVCTQCSISKIDHITLLIILLSISSLLLFIVLTVFVFILHFRLSSFSLVFFIYIMQYHLLHISMMHIIFSYYHSIFFSISLLLVLVFISLLCLLLL